MKPNVREYSASVGVKNFDINNENKIDDFDASTKCIIVSMLVTEN